MKLKRNYRLLPKIVITLIFVNTTLMTSCEPDVWDDLDWFFTDGTEDEDDFKSQPLDSLSQYGSNDPSIYPNDTLQIDF